MEDTAVLVATTLTDEKRCGHCKETKTLDEFYDDRSKPDGKDSWCAECRRVYKRNWARRHRDRINARARERRAIKSDGVKLSRPKRGTSREVTGDGYKDLAIAVLERARLDIEGRYVIVKGSQGDGIVGAVRKDALAWFEQSEQCEDFLEWLGIQTDLTHLIRSCAVD